MAGWGCPNPPVPSFRLARQVLQASSYWDHAQDDTLVLDLLPYMTEADTVVLSLSCLRMENRMGLSGMDDMMLFLRVERVLGIDPREKLPRSEALQEEVLEWLQRRAESCQKRQSRRHMSGCSKRGHRYDLEAGLSSSHEFLVKSL